MILTCPQCQTKFMLDISKLAPEGRQVRCSTCGESWFAAPDPEELALLGDIGSVLADDDSAHVDLDDEHVESSEAEGDEDSGSAEDIEESPPSPFEDVLDSADDVDPMPEAVRPLSDDEVDAAEAETQTQMAFRQMVGGYAAAFFVLLLFMAILFAARLPLVRAWPSLNGFYALAGVSPHVPGEGVVFDKLSARVQRDGHIVISGQLLNLSSGSVDLPLIEASLRDRGQHDIKKWLIEPPTSYLAGEEGVPFEVAYSGHPSAHDVKLRFVVVAPKSGDVKVQYVLMEDHGSSHGAHDSKSGVKDGGSTPAHKKDEHAHQSDGAAHPESHGHDASPAH